MASGLPNPADCCSTCAEEVTIAVPGPAGAAGANGTNGTNGLNAYLLIAAAFTMPAELANVTITVTSGQAAWMIAGQIIYIAGAGHFQVVSTAAASIVAKNLEDTANGMYPANVAPGTVIANGSKLSPAGLQGPTGSAGSGNADADLTYVTIANEVAGLPNSTPLNGIGTGFMRFNDTTDAISTTATIALASQVSGTLPLANGGTGQTTKAAAFNALAPDSAGVAPVRGDMIAAVGGTSYVGLAIGAANTVLRTAGVDPVWGKVVLTTDVTGILPVANGGAGTAVYHTVGTPYPVVATDDVIIGEINGGVIALPDPATMTVGKRITIYNNAGPANPNTVSSAFTIEPAGAVTLAGDGNCVTLVCDALAWYVISLI